MTKIEYADKRTYDAYVDISTAILSLKCVPSGLPEAQEVMECISTLESVRDKVVSLREKIANQL